MKTSLKILHKVPDLEELAAKHQNFDALMDAHADENIRKRKKLYKASSFAMVILATAFLSWLYWGYEPQLTEPVESQLEMSGQPKEQMIPAEKKEQEKEVSPLPEPMAKERLEPAEKEVTERETVVARQKPENKEKKSEEEEIASPQVTIKEKITADAEPVDGLESLYRYLYKEIELPDSLLGADSRLFLEIEFMIGAEGEISEVSFNKELPVVLEKKLRKVFVEMPAWKPALEKGECVESYMNLPITFQKKSDKQ